MFVTWKRIHVFICITILFVAEMHTNIYVKTIQNYKTFCCSNEKEEKIKEKKRKEKESQK
jgi:uncharacterized ion transporter superfamily protein YfcC